MLNTYETDLLLMRIPVRPGTLIACALVLLWSTTGAAAAPSAMPEAGLPDTVIDPRAIRELVQNVVPLGSDRPEDGAPPPEEGPGFAESVRDGVVGQMSLYSGLGAAAALVGLAGFAFVTRHITPREALKNPQRAMIYGFIRATPGAHLKRLSEEFGMKSSSILWHVRKLEAADLVRSQRANGYRVFHPVAGGQELRRLSRGVTALHNKNARRAIEHLQRHPGSAAQDIAGRTGIHPGTVRWHLRKLQDFGLVEEASGVPSRFFVTPLGSRTLDAGAAGGEGPSFPRAPVSPPESA